MSRSEWSNIATDGILVRLFILFCLIVSPGCVTQPRIARNLEHAEHRTVMVVTDDSNHYHFSANDWRIDDEGNLTGKGIQCGLSPLVFHKEVEPTGEFRGTIDRSSIREITGMFPIESKSSDAGVTIVSIGIMLVPFIILARTGSFASL